MKRILLALTGGIAAYKAADVASSLTQLEINVNCAMTESATRFIAPLTLGALTGNPVVTSLWDGGVEHVDLAQSVDLVVVCPATANILGKRAHGIADDFVSTALLATTAPILFCPAMNPEMWANPAVQRNVAQLKADGCEIMQPDSGRLACGAVGAGRLPEPRKIVDETLRLLGGS